MCSRGFAENLTCLQKKKDEQQRRSRIFTKLEDNYLDSKIMDQLHDSKSLSLHLDKKLEGEKKKAEMERSQEDADERRAAKIARIQTAELQFADRVFQIPTGESNVKFDGGFARLLDRNMDTAIDSV